MPKAPDSQPPPKRVVYLWGAGATQAEVSYLGAHNVNLLMRDSEILGDGIATRILKRIPKRWQGSFATDLGTDIEKLISLLAGCNIADYSTLAERLRRLYFEDISASLAKAQVLRQQHLAKGVLLLHKNAAF